MESVYIFQSHIQSKLDLCLYNTPVPVFCTPTNNSHKFLSALHAIMSKEKPLHSPPPITRSDFQAGYMKPASYSRESISAAIIDHRRRTEEELTPRQKDAIERFEHVGGCNLGQPDNIRDFKKFFDVFNDVYFNGTRSGYCQIELVAEEWSTVRCGTPVEGWCYTKQAPMRRTRLLVQR